MPRKAKAEFSEKSLTKGQLRKLNALRKSLGEGIANRAFSEWLSTESVPTDAGDRNVTQIVEALQPLIEANQLRIPRGGYVVRRGRGRVIVERPRGQASDEAA